MGRPAKDPIHVEGGFAQHAGASGIYLGSKAVMQIYLPVAEMTINAALLLGMGLAVGVLSGLFGIGGGFLIVPGLIASTGMPILNAVGSSLVAVTAFGLTTSLNYAFSGLIDWPLALIFIVGGLFGSFGGTLLAKKLAGTTGRLTTAFSVVIFSVAAYMLWKSAGALFMVAKA